MITIMISKRKLNELSRKFITADNVRIAILILPLSYLLIQELKNGTFDPSQFISIGILVSFLIVVISISIANGLSNLIVSKTEDAMKLTEDYSYLVNKYSKEQSKMIQNEKIIYPITLIISRKINESRFHLNIKHDHCNHRYELPKQISEHSEIIIKAHDHSKHYNNTNIRLDNILVYENQIDLLYSKTTYYDSLLTNRAFDFPFKGSRTIREIYEPGPYLSSLKESKMSNHLGFNGFVELKDKSIIFVYRNTHVSISKSKWSTSIAASLKAKHALNDHRQLTIEGLSDAIKNEIRHELKITVQDGVDFSQNIFAFYRDLVEGGKPQFLFYYKSNQFENKDDFKKHFEKALRLERIKHGNQKLLNVDGNTFCFLTLDQLKKSEKGIDYLKTTDGRIMRMVPSMMASIVLFLDFMSDSST